LSSASLDNSQRGSISGKDAVSVSTGAFNNNDGSLGSGGRLALNAGPSLTRTAALPVPAR